ncbi:MAG: glycosyltransferase [Chloroflexota bacterium]
MNPRVSIVTPSYNQGQFIGETIESVLGQDYPDLEYLIIDGGSTDQTVEILRQYDDDPRVTWVSEPDKGMANAINKGFAMSTGTVMGWLNSDDIYLGQVVRDTVDYFNAHPDIDLVYGDAVYTHPDGTPTGKRQVGQPFNFLNTLAYSNSVPQPGTFWRRELWVQAGPLREDLHMALDGEYWLRMSRYGRLRYIPGDRATYRLHDESKTMSQELKSWAERERLAHEMLADPAQYPQVAGNRRLILATLAMQMARVHHRDGDPQAARQHARRALRLLPAKRRALPILATVIDTYLGTGLYGALSRLTRAQR